MDFKSIDNITKLSFRSYNVKKIVEATDQMNISVLFNTA